MGGTNIKAGIVNEDYQILAQKSTPTFVGRKIELIVDDMAGLCNDLLSEIGLHIDSIAGIGIGSPGAIDSDKGVVIYSNNFSWEDIPLLELLQRHFTIPMKIANDAQCATLGEVVAGAGIGCLNMILITLGTGVGGGIVVNRNLLVGNSGNGVIGHMVIRRNGERCTCGRRGCLEAYASATAIIRETKKAIKNNPDSILASENKDIELVNGRSAFDAAQHGCTVAKKIVREYIECLGEGLTNLTDIFRPEKIVISGGICNQGDNLIVPLEQYIHKHCFAGRKLVIPKVERAILGNSAGIIGAASLIDLNEKEVV